MPEESYFLEPKLALAEFGIQLVLSEGFQHEPQMLFMFFLRPGVNKDVINKDDNKIVEVFHEHLIHEVHEIGESIGQSKGHHYVFEQSVMSGKGSLGYILLSYFQLVISGWEVNFLKDSSSIHLVKQVLDFGFGILILDSHLV
jgi:hypothetical protein